MSRVASSMAFPLLGMPIQTRTLIQTMKAAMAGAAGIDQLRRRSTMLAPDTREGS